MSAIVSHIRPGLNMFFDEQPFHVIQQNHSWQISEGIETWKGPEHPTYKGKRLRSGMGEQTLDTKLP